jgi:hypothetical protein
MVCSGHSRSRARAHTHTRVVLTPLRFYAAETLLALEHYHMQGITYFQFSPRDVLLAGSYFILFFPSFQTSSFPFFVLKTNLRGDSCLEDGHVCLSAFFHALRPRRQPRGSVRDVSVELSYLGVSSMRLRAALGAQSCPLDAL